VPGTLQSIEDSVVAVEETDSLAGCHQSICATNLWLLSISVPHVFHLY